MSELDETALVRNSDIVQIVREALSPPG